MEINQIFSHTIEYINSLHPFYIYLTVFFFSFMENIFPPVPGDTITIFAAYLSGTGKGSVLIIILITISASIASYTLMFYIGKYFSNSKFMQKLIINKNAIKTIKILKKYGYIALIFNRFLSGFRSFMSLIAGMLDFKPIKTISFSAFAIITWNLIIISAGYFAADNWKKILNVLRTYNMLFYSFLALVIIYFVAKFIIKKTIVPKNI